MQPIQRILVATDLSELSAAAVSAAVEHARSWGAELRGRHGQTGTTGVLLGSVAERVVRTSSRPVLIVPPETATHGTGISMRPPPRASCWAATLKDERTLCR